ncbi:FecR family protein [Marinomonas aquiplantarum]|uniref:FecR family protein n=1 Tax=Marinomonas aquiplantarum TaxID=491951 RepID=A0A366CUN1_9GAMM|nr:FecR domain-containing protein [Marinomonas aquiplantarum]RBO80023.1 FecR family protein [Marinomonas aquiplantarum]
MRDVAVGTFSMMNSKSNHFKQLEAASEWFAILSDEAASEQDKQAWLKWLEADIEHQRAWSKVESVGAMFDSFQQQGLNTPVKQVLDNSHARQVSRRQFSKGLLGVTAALGIGWIGWEKASLPSMVAVWNADFHTSTGELKRVALADGSDVWLNTYTGLNDEFDDNVRAISLISGEAFFDLNETQDERPFLVSCPHAVIKLTSQKARFCLRHLSDQQAVLAVYHGQLSFSSLHSKQSMLINAGKEVHLHKNASMKPQPVMAMYESWTRGQLIVDDMSLKDFINEIGRYQHGHINLDSSLESWRVVGTYPTQDIDTVLTMLETAFPIKVEKIMPWWINISAA